MSEIKKVDITQNIFVLENVLSKEECKLLIAKSENVGYEEATVFTGSEHKLIKGIRNNMRVLIDDQELSDNIWKKVAPFFEKEINGFSSYGLNERFRYYKYEIGQRFNKHKDGSFVRDIGDKSIFTFMVYLNEEFEGGTTDFEDDISIRPKTGSALVFLHPLRHIGTRVTKGIKYAIRSDVMYKRI